MKKYLVLVPLLLVSPEPWTAMAHAASASASVDVRVSLPALSILYCVNALRRHPGRSASEIAACRGYVAVRSERARTGSRAAASTASADMPAPVVRTIGGRRVLEVVAP